MKAMLVASLFTVALVGCSKSAAPDSAASDNQFVTYQCESDVSFDVAYLSNEKAVLRLPDNEYQLTQVPAGSGTKYILDDGTSEMINSITLRTKGDDARLELGRVVYRNCQK
ncbi:MliC family protein [Vibrio crassostreae]|uniref:MliC family protein n=1 Tax=Vibrio crassostreae TaxID=246167 RepID=UPI000F482E8F|nr:MliC family protein [Vibrio crassostreae]ROQ86957.1 membrane-bound inhibitor of C-type lysozyme [Vibrio crassostreae]ROR78660.1 membrane-bound inhibitor of C-type lysozyme [Vibrio crassostreae]TQL31511.1 membrane-bound inhibitor of C-type lysozyme [Vibrio crassostreae]